MRYLNNFLILFSSMRKRRQRVQQQRRRLRLPRLEHDKRQTKWLLLPIHRSPRILSLMSNEQRRFTERTGEYIYVYLFLLSFRSLCVAAAQAVHVATEDNRPTQQPTEEPTEASDR